MNIHTHTNPACKNKWKVWDNHSVYTKKNEKKQLPCNAL